MKIVSASKFAFAGKTAISCRLLKFVLTLSRHEKRLGKAKRSCPIRGFPISLAGCGIQHFFAVIFGIWAQNWSEKREQSGIRDFNPSFRVLLKPWSSRRHFFSHFAFASRTTDQRKKDTSKIDQRKNHQLAETNLLCLLCVWLCEQECVHSEKMF